MTALEKFIVATITSQSSGSADKKTQNKKGAGSRPYLAGEELVSLPLESVFKEESVPVGAVALVSRRESFSALSPFRSRVSQDERPIQHLKGGIYH